MASHDPKHMLRVLKPKLETVDAGFGIDAMTLEARETAGAKPKLPEGSKPPTALLTCAL